MTRALRWCAGRWNRFFFEPVRPESLAAFRIAFGLCAIAAVLGRIPDRLMLYGAEGLVRPETALRFFSPGSIGYALARAVPGTSAGLAAFLGALLAAAVLVTAGLATRPACVALALGLTALSDRNPAVENSGDDLLRLFSLCLCFSAAGAVWSLDRALARRRGASSPVTEVSRWPLRLLQLQLAYVYLDTVYLKLHGAAWRDGTAVYYALHYLELRRLSVGWLLGGPFMIHLATWGTLAVEGAMATLVWWRPARYPCLLAALLLHLFLNASFQFPVFQYVMIAGLLVFVEPEDLLRLPGMRPWEKRAKKESSSQVIIDC